MTEQNTTQERAKVIIESSGILLTLLTAAVTTIDHRSDILLAFFAITTLIFVICIIIGFTIIFEIPISYKIKNNPEKTLKETCGLFIKGLTSTAVTIVILFIQTDPWKVLIAVLVAIIFILIVLNRIAHKAEEKPANQLLPSASEELFIN